ncbi:MAG: hypothetical protein HOB63_09435, partial [Opitutae bacterium]|nr:hypothetical protein [Opitutae bacterium]
MLIKTGITRGTMAYLSLLTGLYLVPATDADAVRPVFTVNSPTYSYPIPVEVVFKKDDDSNVSVTGFDANDLNVTNGTALSFSGTGHVYNFNIEPTSDPAFLTIS